MVNNNTNTNSTGMQSADRNLQMVNNNEISYWDLWYKCLRNWKWFVLSVIVCLAVAISHLLTTPNTYSRYASILVKEESSGKSLGTNVAKAFGDMGMSATNTNVYNELQLMLSNDLALDIVKRMALNVNYFADGTFHAINLYGNSLPVKVEFPNIADDANVSFDITFNGGDNVTLSNFKQQGEELAGEVKAKLGYNIAHTPIGRVVITKSKNISKKNTQNTIHVYRSSIDAAKSSFSSRFGAALSDKNSTVIDMQFNDVSKQRAEDVLNTVIAIYNERWVQDKNLLAVSTSQFINERLQVIEKELGHVDSNISEYKTAHQITDLKASSTLYLQQSTAADANIMDLNNQIYMAKYIRGYLVNQGTSLQLLPANVGFKNSSVENQIKDYNNSVLQYNNIVSNSSDKNPIAVDLYRQLTSMRTAIINSIDNELTTLNAQLGSQRSLAGDATSKITSNPRQTKDLLSVERQQKVKESLYLFLLQKREENELSQAFTSYNTRVVSHPYGSLRPSSPNTNKILLLAFALGLVIPLAIIYLREMLNTTVRTKKDIENKLTMPYLGDIPIYKANIPVKKWMKWKKRTPRNFVVKEGSRGVMNEAFRIVITNLEFMNTKQSANDEATVYMVTSYNQGSGKSFCTNNLAATIAIKQKRVLVIDGDLRHASTSQFINSPKKGLADYLTGNVDNLSSVIVKGEMFKNMDVLPVGTIPPNPTELLASAEFGNVISEMRSQYDYIFIDCPPANMMADATIIGKHIDRTIFIIRAGLFERSMLQSIESDYQNSKLKNMAILLNGVDIVNTHYGYGYGYGYGYANSDSFNE